MDARVSVNAIVVSGKLFIPQTTHIEEPDAYHENGLLTMSCVAFWVDKYDLKSLITFRILKVTFHIVVIYVSYGAVGIFTVITPEQ